MKIDRLDHLVLTVKNVEATCAFYTSVLGMEEETFGKGRRAVTFGRQKINLHPCDEPFEPNALYPTPGSADICFITPLPISAVIEHVRSCGVKIIEGPVQRLGAVGTITSLYFRDPDGNLIEISEYQK